MRIAAALASPAASYTKEEGKGFSFIGGQGGETPASFYIPQKWESFWPKSKYICLCCSVHIRMYVPTIRNNTFLTREVHRWALSRLGVPPLGRVN